MDMQEREELEWFCAESRCYIEGIEGQEIFDKVLQDMKRLSDEDLKREADFLDDVMGK